MPAFYDILALVKNFCKVFIDHYYCQYDCHGQHNCLALRFHHWDPDRILYHQFQGRHLGQITACSFYY
ncbi:hypothetical protein VTO42DRAFT_7842 [Malbranchea cinnamomea]